MGAELIGWHEKRKPRGQTGTGSIRHGLGVALHQWGGGGTQDKKVSCTINADGSVELRSATQDIGTGARTILAIIAAEVLGLKPTDIFSNIGTLGLSARPGVGRLDHDALDGSADAMTRPSRHATRSSRRSRRPSRPSPPTSASRTASSGSRASR